LCPAKHNTPGRPSAQACQGCCWEK
jgi:hypothetical protein